ncbi:MAG: rod shape-determining protein RodA [Bdellovibrionales bacterium]|nr:rod shape-determining protein RodA [Bdellovibrionales bacterium]
MKFDMQVEERNFFRRLDANLIFVVIALNIIGLINLYSATHGVNLSFQTSLFWQQLVWLTLGWALFFGITVIDYNFFKRGAYIFYAVNLIALVLVIFKGKVSYGAQRWLDLGFFRYQPSETMKLVLVLILAKVLSKKSKPGGLGFTDLVVPGVITLIPVALTIKQPDLGTGLLLLAVMVSMTLFIKVKKTVLVTFLILAMIASPLVWSFGLKSYQKNRVLTFLNPGRDARGAGYNSIQSRIAVGSGKIVGKGFRKGTQSQLEFLPERHTDFIFSVLSEEHGFVGSMTAVGLFIALLFMCGRIASQARDRFGMLVAVGSLSILFWHMLINISMVIGLLPIVGVPLPLLSYGGSMIITTMASLGIISSVAYRKYLF